MDVDLVGRDALAPQALLLGEEELLADPVRVVGAQELAFLRVDASDCLLRCHAVLATAARDVSQLLEERISELVSLGLAKRNVAVEASDRSFERVKPVIRLRARTVLLADAEEVLVLLAVAAPILAVEQTGATLAAEQSPSEVMVVTPSASAVMAPCRNDILNALKELHRDQRFVPAAVWLPVDGHHAGVVRIAKQVRQPIRRDALSGIARRWARPEAPRLE